MEWKVLTYSSITDVPVVQVYQRAARSASLLKRSLYLHRYGVRGYIDWIMLQYIITPGINIFTERITLNFWIDLDLKLIGYIRWRMAKQSLQKYDSIWYSFDIVNILDHSVAILSLSFWINTLKPSCWNVGGCRRNGGVTKFWDT